MPALPKTCTAELPEFGFLRLSQIVGDVDRGIPPILPISKDQFYFLVREGKIRRPIKLGPKTSVWTVAYIRGLVADIEASGALL